MIFTSLLSLLTRPITHILSLVLVKHFVKVRLLLIFALGVTGKLFKHIGKLIKSFKLVFQCYGILQLLRSLI